MLYYIKHYPISLIILAIICYLSFFTPPKTDLNEILNLDKLVHFCMYFGFSSMIWIEYLWSHSSIRWKRIIPGAVLLPILISGLIEILQENCTDTRSGDWLDFLANSVGALASIPACHYIYRFLVWRYLKRKSTDK